MTEGYLWTGQYPECKRIIEQGNNHSMELDEGTLDGTWTKDNNGKPQFFIINEAIISKLCILGEECEPCFEGSSITKFSLSFDDSFKNELYSMMNELKELLKEGGAKVFNRYAVEIGDSLWSALWEYVNKAFPDSSNNYCSKYRIDGVFEDNSQKFAILQDRVDMKYYRLNFSLSDSEGFVPAEGLIEVTKSYTPATEPQFALDAVEAYEAEFKKKQEEENKKTNDDESDNSGDPENKKDDSSSNNNGQKSENKDDDSSEDDEDEKKKKKYSLDEIEEYINLKAEYEELQNKFSLLETENKALKETNASLTEFKNNVERKDKEAMIQSFYMLSDDDKKDVIDNIDKYSVDDIEAKLSVICVRNKVNFNLDDDNNNKGPTTYNLSNLDDDSDAGMPAWVKAVLESANKN